MPCHAILSNPTGTYFPGSIIEGKLVCIFDKQINVNSIKVILRGKEETKWSKSKHKKRRKYYSGTNKFLKSEVNFAGEGFIGPGTFEFPFQFILPKNCPGSFKSDHGVIWYYLEGLVDASWECSFDNHSIITVIAPIDLNDPILDLNTSPNDFQVEKLLGCCCFSRGSAELSVHLDKAAFVLGEVVNIQVQLSNTSSLNVKGLSAKLTMVIKHKATFPKKKSKHSRSLVASVYKSGISGQGKRNYDLNLLIPPEFVLPNFSMCILFKTWYTLKVKAEFPGCHRCLEVAIPVFLCHVSEISRQSQAVFVRSNDYIQSVPPSFLTSSFPLIDNLDAPTSMSNRAYLPEVHSPGRSEQTEASGSGVIPMISVVAADQEWEELDDALLRTDFPAQSVPPPFYDEVMRDAPYPGSSNRLSIPKM